MPPDPRFRQSSTASSAGRDGFERLSPELQAVAGSRLGLVAIIYGGTWFAMYAANYIQYVVSTGSWQVPHGEWAVKTLIAVVLSALVLLKVWKGRVSPRNFMRVAFAFEMLGALLIVHDRWGWETRLAAELELLVASGADLARILPDELVRPTELFSYDGINFVAIWLLLFPLVVPRPPRKALIHALLTASTVPALALGSVWAHGMPDVVAPLADRYLFDMTLPVYVVAGAAVFAAHVVYRLTHDLSREKELGSYRLREKIGEGGMGEVWRAEHRLLARPAAVKLIRQDAAEASVEPSGTALKRFEREAQATAMLKSPHTIEVYDFGITGDGTFYYVMELLDGLDLRTLVERHGPVPARRVVEILDQAAHSLQDAHQTGLVHRDIKPGNIFVGRRGPDPDFVKVLDFGLVKHLDRGGDGSTQLTMQGITSGTPAFMAPETAAGGGAPDARSDLYALGCVAYWLLTGCLVFEDKSPMAVIVKHVKEEPPPPSVRTELEIPGPVDRLVLELLAKSPSDRPASAGELRRRLREIRSEIGSWTPEEAERWWAVHHPESGARASAPAPDLETRPVV